MSSMLLISLKMDLRKSYYRSERSRATSLNSFTHLDQNATTNLKVIGIQRSPPDRCLGHIHLPFSPYTIPQLLSIIEGRLTTYQPVFASFDLNPTPTDAPMLLTPHQRNQFLSLARDSIHFITFRTHEIDEIWATVTSLWEKHSRLSRETTEDFPKLSSKYLEAEIGLIFKGLAIHTLEAPSVGQTNRQRKDPNGLKRSLSTRSNDSIASDSNASSLFRSPAVSINMNTCELLSLFLPSHW
jgi:hypothetical protein